MWTDAGYQGVEKRPENGGMRIEWRVAMRPSVRRGLDPESAQAQGEKRKASIRAKVEHPFLYVKRHFGYAKVRYRGLQEHAATGYAVWAGESAEGGAFLGGGMMGSSVPPMGECG